MVAYIGLPILSDWSNLCFGSNVSPIITHAQQIMQFWVSERQQWTITVFYEKENRIFYMFIWCIVFNLWPYDKTEDVQYCNQAFKWQERKLKPSSAEVRWKTNRVEVITLF